MNAFFGNLFFIGFLVVAFMGLLAALVSVLVHREQRNNADICEHILAAPLEAVSVLPGDFPWVDRKEYDRERRYLEDRGFRFAGDVEFVNFRRVAANPRAFFRFMLSEDGTVRVSIVHSYHSFSYNLIERVFGKMRGRVAVEVNAEALDGRFFAVTSAFAPNPLAMPPEVTQVMLPPGLGVERTLAEFEERYRLFREANPDFVPRPLSGDRDAVESEIRQSDQMRRHRAEVGFLTVDEVVAGGMKNRDQAEKLVRDLQKELWRRGVMK